MKYKVIWSKFAEQQVDEIFKFYRQKTESYQTAKKIISKIVVAPDRLKTNPLIGQKEISLEKRTFEYRYVVESNYKIIYSVDDEKRHIKIADVFDTRQDPTKIKRNK